MSGQPGLAASTTRVLLAEALVVPSGLVTAAYLGRALGPEFYGLFSVASAISITLEWTVVSLFSRTIVKVIGETDDWKPVASTILRIHVVASLLVALALWAGAGAIARLLGDPRLGTWLSLLAFEVPVGATAAACRNIMTGRGDYRGRALSTGVRWLLRPIAIVLFVQSGLAVTGAVLGSVVAAVAGCATAMAMAHVPLRATARAPIASLWRVAVPTFVLAISLRVIDKLGLFATQAAGPSPLEAGWYAAAQNFALAPGLFAMSFSPLLLAEVARTRGRGTTDDSRRLVAQAFRVAIALLPLVGIVAGSAREIVHLIYGPAFDAAAALSWPLLAAAFATLLTSVATSVLIASDRPTTAATCVWPTLPLAALVLLVVVPRYGSLGAAIVTAAIVWISATAALTMVGVTLGVWPPMATTARSVAIALVVTSLAAWWPTPGLWLIGKVMALSGLALLAYLCTGEFASGSGSVSAGRHDSGHYWDAVAADWHDDPSDPHWRAHSDTVNLVTCGRYWPTGSVGRVLKTDLFDEVAGRGLIPDLRKRTASIVAIDRSFETARLGRRRAGAVSASADVRQLPFIDDVFDVVVSNSTLDDFDDAAGIGHAVAEIHRVLAPGGRLVITLDNPANPAVALRNALPFSLLHRLGVIPYYVGATLSAPRARALLEANGFVVREVTAIMHCPRAPAIAALRLVRLVAGDEAARGLCGGMLACERLERWPTRQQTGYFVALVADKAAN